MFINIVTAQLTSANDKLSETTIYKLDKNCKLKNTNANASPQKTQFFLS